MNTCVRQNQHFVHDTVSYWQPMQFLNYRGDMVMKTCAVRVTSLAAEF